MLKGAYSRPGVFVCDLSQQDETGVQNELTFNFIGSGVMSDPFTRWTVRIVLAGLFLVFLVDFGQFVVQHVWSVIGPLVHH